MDIDVKQFLNFKRWFTSAVEEKTSWIPQREKDSIYQDGKIVAKIIEGKINQQNNAYFFKEIYNSNNLNLEKEFEFQKFKLKHKRHESGTYLDVTQPHKGKIIENVICEIIGERGFK